MNFSFLFPIFLLLPFVVIIYFGIFLFKGKHKGLLYSFLFYILIGIIGTWTIFQSTSSTGALGFIVLPFFMTFGATGIWVFENFKNHSRKSLKILGWLGLVTALLCLGMYGYSGYIQKITTQTKIKEMRRESDESNRYQIQLKEKLKSFAGDKSLFLYHELKNQINNPVALNVIAQFPELSQDDLRGLYQGKRASVIIILQNKSTSANLIEEIYKTTDNRDYILSALILNPLTPEWILREMFTNPSKTFTFTTFHHFYAQNPSTPKDILMIIANTKSQWTVLKTLQNPNIDCSILQIAKASLPNTDNPNDSETLRLITEREAHLCH